MSIELKIINMFIEEECDVGVPFIEMYIKIYVS